MLDDRENGRSHRDSAAGVPSGVARYSLPLLGESRVEWRPLVLPRYVCRPR